MAILDLHPAWNGERYAVSGIYEDEEEAKRIGEALFDKGNDVALFYEEAPDGVPLFFLARKAMESRPTRLSGFPQLHSWDWEFTRFVKGQFQAIERHPTYSVSWYKPFDVVGLHNFLNGFNWGGTCIEVLSNFASKVILRHFLPNANHRTTVAVCRHFLNMQGIEWPRLAVTGRGSNRFYSEMNPTFIQSKAWLLAHRRDGSIRRAAEHGYTNLLVRPGHLPVPLGYLLQGIENNEIEDSHLALWEKALLRQCASDADRELLTSQEMTHPKLLMQQLGGSTE